MEVKETAAVGNKDRKHCGEKGSIDKQEYNNVEEE